MTAPTCRCGVWESAHQEGRGCGNFRKASRIRIWLQDHSVKAHIMAPIWLRVPEKRRWMVVYWLNRSQRQCWSDLVSDALAWPESDPCNVHFPSLHGEHALRCASVCEWGHPDHVGEHQCYCYCGKFQFVAPRGATDSGGAA